MKTVAQSTGICTSIFKSTTAEEIAKGLNRKWIELINRSEQLKKDEETDCFAALPHDAAYPACYGRRSRNAGCVC